MEQTQLSRGQFLRQLGLSSAALMSFYCLGTSLTACSSSSDDPTPTTNTNNNTNTNTNTGITGTTTGAVDFTIDLTHKDYTKLKTEGEFVYVADIIIANAKGTFVALAKACTHQGTTINYRSGTNDFFCPNHGSEFKTTGAVQKSPATTALKVYKAETTNSGNSLKITA